MPEMPEFVLQLEQASGLPWWCLLLLAVLVLIILILAVSLGREKRRNRVGAVDIPRGTTPAAADDEASEEDAAEPEEDGDNLDDSDDGIAETAAAPEDEAESPIGDEPSEVSANDEVADESWANPDEPQEEDESPADGEETVDVAPSEDAPEVEVLSESHASGTESFELDDREIFKATGGSHSRVGQSAFGIDFGFLEEYEADYEHALEEFRRLRGKTQEEDK